MDFQKQKINEFKDYFIDFIRYYKIKQLLDVYNDEPVNDIDFIIKNIKKFDVSYNMSNATFFIDFEAVFETKIDAKIKMFYNSTLKINKKIKSKNIVVDAKKMSMLLAFQCVKEKNDDLDWE